MSKSLGNSPDLLELIDKYGADAVRFGILISSPAGNDLLFDEGALEQGRNFNNKLWNALKLVKGWEGRLTDSDPSDSTFVVSWFENKLQESRETIENLSNEFKLSEALKTLYSLIWDDFCSWYLEWVKPEFNTPVNSLVYRKTVGFFEQLIQFLHPYMPFITEEIYHLLAERSKEDDLCIKQFDKTNEADKKVIAKGELFKRIIADIRNAKAQGGFSSFSVYFYDEEFEELFPLLKKIVKAAKVDILRNPLEGTITFVIDKVSFIVSPDNLNGISFKKEQLLKDLEYQKQFLNTVNQKLENQRFVENAKPEVVALERKKKEDAQDKIRVLEESLAGIK
jgi:valyl-tRNA synthetase